jgi:hypothetical protein
MPDHEWPLDIAHSQTDFFGANQSRESLFVAGSDGGVYLAPIRVLPSTSLHALFHIY